MQVHMPYAFARRAHANSTRLAAAAGVQFGLIQMLKLGDGRASGARLAQAALLPMAGLACVLAFAQLGQPQTAAGAARFHLAGPEPLGYGGRISLEAPLAPGTFPRLCVVGGRVFDETALVATYTFFGRVLDMRRPFTVLWDPRPLVWPRLTPRLLRMVREWVDANARRWDQHVQAHAILLTNPLLRPIARLLCQLFAPPQPIRIVADEASAAAFAREVGGRARSWVKESYADRDQRFGRFAARAAVGGEPPMVSTPPPAISAPPPATRGKVPANSLRGLGRRRQWRGRGRDALAADRGHPSCAAVAPSLTAWARALGTHLALLVLTSGPLGAMLYATPCRVRGPVALLTGLAAAVAVPLYVGHARASHPEPMPWMVPFLASTFGFRCTSHAHAHAHVTCTDAHAHAHADGASPPVAWLQHVFQGDGGRVRLAAERGGQEPAGLAALVHVAPRALLRQGQAYACRPS